MNNNNERKDALLMEAIAEALVRQKRSSHILLKVDEEGTSLTLGRGDHNIYSLPFISLWVGKEPGSSIRCYKGGGFAGKSTDLLYGLQQIPFINDWDKITSSWGQPFGERRLPDNEAFYVDEFDNGLAYRAFIFTPEGKEEIEGREEDVELETYGAAGPDVNIRKGSNSKETFFDLFDEPF